MSEIATTSLKSISGSLIPFNISKLKSAMSSSISTNDISTTQISVIDKTETGTLNVSSTANTDTLNVNTLSIATSSYAPTQNVSVNDNSIATTAYVNQKFEQIIGGNVNDLLNSISEIDAALGSDPNFSQTITNLINTKAGLNSSNNFTTDNRFTNIIYTGQINNVPSSKFDYLRSINSDVQNQLDNKVGLIDYNHGMDALNVSIGNLSNRLTIDEANCNLKLPINDFTNYQSTISSSIGLINSKMQSDELASLNYMGQTDSALANINTKLTTHDSSILDLSNNKLPITTFTSEITAINSGLSNINDRLTSSEAICNSKLAISDFSPYSNSINLEISNIKSRLTTDETNINLKVSQSDYDIDKINTNSNISLLLPISTFTGYKTTTDTGLANLSNELMLTNSNFSNYYNKQTVDSKFDLLTNGASSQLDTLKEIGDYITGSNSDIQTIMSVLPTKVDVGTMGNYYLKSDIDTKLNLKANNSSLSSYVLSTDLTLILYDYMMVSTLGTTLANYVSTSTLNTVLGSYITNDSIGNTLTNYITSSGLTSALSSYAPISSLSNYITGTSLATTLTGYITTSGLTSALSSYATISSLSNYITGTSLATTLTGYITTSGLTSALSSYPTTSYLTTQLASYITSSSLTTTLAGYITTSYLTTQLASYAPISNTVLTGTTNVMGCVETISNQTVSSNALSYSYGSGAIFYCSPSSATNMTLNLTSIPTTTYRTITITAIINAATYKQYFSTVSINGTSYTLKYLNGSSSVSVSSSTLIYQQLYIHFLNSNTPSHVSTSITQAY